MCGICGWFRPEPVAPTDGDRHILTVMTRTLVHRGPDDEGFYLDDQAALGFRRLSIIDLTGGRQPMANEDGTVWVVFNGEIYNFRELRRELEVAGHVFRTRSDTEVIVHGYEVWGVDVVQRLRGMFGIALWDRRRRQALLARDPIGIKPLFYTQLPDGRLLFGSELKAILAHPEVERRLNPSALDAYLSLEYIPAPATLFDGIAKLPAGHWLLYRDGRWRVQCFWDVLPEADFRPERPRPAYLAELRDRLRDAVQSHTVSDVPVGTFLSGGMDSSTVVAMLHDGTNPSEPVRTFSIGFDDPSYDELPYARLVAARYRTLHTEAVLSYDIVTTVERLLDFLDEPLADFSIFPTYLVSKMAREHVKVILSGDGGDEVFAGYEHYLAWKLHRPLAWIPYPLRRWLGRQMTRWLAPAPQKKGLVNRLRRFGEGLQHEDDWDHVRWLLFLNRLQKADLYAPDLQAVLRDGDFTVLMEPYLRRARLFRDPINAALYIDLKTYLAEDILPKVDRMSMAVSLETRVPLLDSRLVEWVFRLPGRWKLRGWTTKWVLKEAMRPYLPPEILRREKQGFSIPMKNWLRQELRSLLLDYLNPTAFRRHGLFQWGTVERWIQEHLAFQADHAHRLWALLLFQAWYDRVLSARPRETAVRQSGSRAIRQ
jgi:asparagine synthase (glutamine-hydrolysing)